MAACFIVFIGKFMPVEESYCSLQIMFLKAKCHGLRV